MLDTIQKVVSVLVQLVTVVVALFAVWYYTQSVQGGFADRTSRWVDNLKPQEGVWKQMNETGEYLDDPKVTQQEKLQRLKTDGAFATKVAEVLNYCEDLGYLYEKKYIDRDFIKRGAGGVLVPYFDEAKFWVDQRRTRDQSIWRECDMVNDLRGGAH